MIKRKKVGIVIPAYNEEDFILPTLKNVPSYVDFIVCVNDGSSDKTAVKIVTYKKRDKRVIMLNNIKNRGVGFSVKVGIKELFTKNTDYIVIAAGDNQCDLRIINKFVSICEEHNYDVCRGNRFLNQQELFKMPFGRRIGNSIYSFITKFVSGYYSLFDFQSSYSAIRSKKLKEIEINNLRDDYLFDNSLWINLNIVNAKIKEVSIPIMYGNEISNINYFSFIRRSFSYLLGAFLSRIYKKYILILHPVGIFLISGSALFLFGLLYGLYIAFDSIGPKSATSATVMLSVIPFLTGFQLILQGIVLDIQNEPK